MVKTDLGESVALHPLNLLNNKSVLTYMNKNQAIPQAGESSKQSGEKSSENKFIVEGLQSLTNRPEKEAVEKKKEKTVAKKRKETVVLVKKAVAGIQDAPDKSKYGTSSDEDSRPLSKLGIAKKGGAVPKRKLVLASSDSNSTVSLTLVAITKRQRTKLVKKTVDDQSESNRGPIPEIPAEAKDASTAAAQETNEETQAVTKECRIVVRSEPEQVAQQSMTFARKDPDQKAEEQPTKEAEQRILAIEHRAHEEQKPAPEEDETARIEQQAQEQIEEIIREHQAGSPIWCKSSSVVKCREDLVKCRTVQVQIKCIIQVRCSGADPSTSTVIKCRSDHRAQLYQFIIGISV
ncbi:protein timeless [Dorcoceras hygrometricum]|uniref:Protein timeless n=1 Tax=Dorcoceras hygrometricum TaxID=472368 RepID=A0A2Z7CIM8_9LAMI|nr:protein timeless [Dorcoceras hygrometricum]